MTCFVLILLKRNDSLTHARFVESIRARLFKLGPCPLVRGALRIFEWEKPVASSITSACHE